ncbi:bifunctional tRNA (5-methylaminomethyl-2-thiouridine)(34)-methyltransferase MnmD/FAD-dependent 5-carboxymethylaminomethyl-2-thiouridine(34) oxidoreductase MnmC [Legionella waltersii]|uniref:tRNA 5-methylaminomethyl-2-thiouridine biosynthesis bifunctional protein MnmC n=1 Tax=Legionella waltersii TaxID=66969 RepID=A0A0W1A160_9GAMM|nr:bifunctional tRNA (5-methylaminomethyl-2-thiouridine)(34)-methyltransferase MnmD/FAD-dependent 5-carboxymethylaminomethyl-2-thiouridine(34) oxidoreductase MnmC [Legionella waltersii]KTD75066.1 putative peptidase [Legionella waltersii]SNV05293.1 putative peptidase [Legionella waltersii]
MSSHFIPIQTADLEWKQDLPYSRQFNDIYYSSEGGLQQSRYVFIDGNDLINRWRALTQNQKSYFNIGETGFGTGMNFLLTWKLWEENAPSNATLHYISCEKHPLTKDDLIKCLNAWPEIASYVDDFIELYPVLTPGFHHLLFAQGRVKLTLMLGDAQECYEQLLVCGHPKLEHEIRTPFIDAWYLDGFAPSKNQRMWSDSLLKIIAQLSRKESTLATYSASGMVKLSLANAGFMVFKRKGFGPKRHMITAQFTEPPQENNRPIHTPWHASKRYPITQKSALIIGAGLAGCFVANSLAKRDWKVTVLEKQQSLALGGSGNQQAVIFPKLSAYKSPFTQFMLYSFLFANRYYKQLLKTNPIGKLTGTLLLDYNEKERAAHLSLVDWLSYYPELGELVSSIRASELAGVTIPCSGLYIPMSGWINSPELCHLLTDNKNIQLLYGEEVNSINYMNGNWHVNGRESPVLILANGHEGSCFQQTNYLPIKSIGGQMTMIKESTASKNLKIPICGDGHVLPSYKGCHHVGATYHLTANKAHLSDEDDVLNQLRLKHLSEQTTWSDALVSSWAGVRATSPDYLPIVGAVAKENEFLHTFATLKSNSKRWIPKLGPYYQDLYICSAFGSRGLTTVPLAAEWLASMINNELSFLPRHLIQALSPARFLRKKIIHGI